MLTVVSQYWPFLTIAVLIGVGALVWMRRKKRVDLGIDHAKGPRPTLARKNLQVAEPQEKPDPLDDFLRIAPMAGTPDNLLEIKGLGPRIAMLLNGLGVTRFEQIAILTETQQRQLDRHLGPFKGRMVQDRWLDQARMLADGDRDAFEAEFGSIEEAKL